MLTLPSWNWTKVLGGAGVEGSGAARWWAPAGYVCACAEPRGPGRARWASCACAFRRGRTWLQEDCRVAGSARLPLNMEPAPASAPLWPFEGTVTRLSAQPNSLVPPKHGIGMIFSVHSVATGSSAILFAPTLSACFDVRSYIVQKDIKNNRAYPKSMGSAPSLETSCMRSVSLQGAAW